MGHHSCNSRSLIECKSEMTTTIGLRTWECRSLKSQPQEFQSRLVKSFFIMLISAKKKTGSQTTCWKFATVSKHHFKFWYVALGIRNLWTPRKKKSRSHESREENLYQTDCSAFFHKFNILKVTLGFNSNTVQLNTVKCIAQLQVCKVEQCSIKFVRVWNFFIQQSPTLQYDSLWWCFISDQV